jgi:hypothetical protein
VKGMKKYRTVEREKLGKTGIMIREKKEEK